MEFGSRDRANLRRDCSCWEVTSQYVGEGGRGSDESVSGGGREGK